MTEPSCRPIANPPVEHPVTVVAAKWITPRTRRLVFAGDGLAAAFATPPGTYAPYLKLVLGDPARPVLRTYSVRRLDPGRDEVHVDFVLHDLEGPGSAFGREAGPGTTARLRGPWHLGLAECRHHYLVADHCGVPALACILEQLPADATGTALIEVPDEAEIQTLRGPAGIEITWLLGRPGAAGPILARPDMHRAPASSETLVWAGAEARVARLIRRACKGEWKVPLVRCQVLNYWRSGRAEGQFSFIA